MPCFCCYWRSKQQKSYSHAGFSFSEKQAAISLKNSIKFIWCGQYLQQSAWKRFPVKACWSPTLCYTSLSHMRSSESHMHLFLWKDYHVRNILKLDMIFPLLPALRSQTTLTSAGKITLYFLGSFKRTGFHFLYNPSHPRKDLWLLFVRECFSFWLKPLLFYTSLVSASVLSFAPGEVQGATIHYKMIFLSPLPPSIDMFENRSYMKKSSTEFMCPDV